MPLDSMKRRKIITIRLKLMNRVLQNYYMCPSNHSCVIYLSLYQTLMIYCHGNIHQNLTMTVNKCYHYKCKSMIYAAG